MFQITQDLILPSRECFPVRVVESKLQSKMGKVKKVLIVDDDNVCNIISEKVLRSVDGYLDIVVCSNGKEAIDHLLINNRPETALPDIILLDIDMPIMNGWEFLQEYHKVLPTLKKQIQIWVLSSTVLPKEIERVKSCSLLSGFISKPFIRENALELLSPSTRSSSCGS